VVGGNSNVRAVVLEAVARLPGFQSCTLFATGAEAIRLLPGLEVEIALVALTLPDLCGIRCGRELCARKSGLKAVLIASADECALVGHAMASGFDYCLPHPFDLGRCVETLLFVLACPVRGPGTSLCDPGPCTRPLASPGLTREEDRIMACLAEGRFYKEIEADLGFSRAKVCRLVHSSYTKLGAQKATEAVEKWRRSSSPHASQGALAAGAEGGAP
jgi:DNA-binding NarL/FixJ family response regulator